MTSAADIVRIGTGAGFSAGRLEPAVDDAPPLAVDLRQQRQEVPLQRFVAGVGLADRCSSH